MSALQIVLLIVLVVLIIGLLPPLGVVAWGYYPSGLLLVLLVVLIVMALSGRSL